MKNLRLAERPPLRIEWHIIGIIFIVLGLLLPVVGMGMMNKAYDREIDDDYTAGDKLREIAFGDTIVEWGQIIVLAGIGFILFGRLEKRG